jgi:hypothetical protein
VELVKGLIDVSLVFGAYWVSSWCPRWHPGLPIVSQWNLHPLILWDIDESTCVIPDLWEFIDNPSELNNIRAIRGTVNSDSIR